MTLYDIDFNRIQTSFVELYRHHLSHTHATTLIENGADLKDVQERIGHSKIAITIDTYTSMKSKSIDIFEKTAGLSTTQS